MEIVETNSFPVKNSQSYFLSGGGEMGSLTRLKEWSKTSLGPPEKWPQSLKSTLSIILNSKFPMFLFWGPELICFYNDAYRPSLGNNGKHPSILGMRGEEAWPEIWDFIKPLIDGVLSGGEASWSEDQLLPIYRNGKMEDVYWTFSYSPVTDESGMHAGVFVTCSETTDKVKTLAKLTESNDQLAFAIEATELGTFDFNPENNSFIANNRLKEWFGLTAKDEIELHYAIEAIADNDRQKVAEAIQNAMNYSSGGHYDIEYTIIHPSSKKETIVRAKGKVSFRQNKTPYRFNGTLQDITMQVIAQRKLEESERRLRLIISEAPVSIAILRGPTYVVEIANSKSLALWGRQSHEIINKSILEAMPELDEQGIKTLLDDVYNTGKSFNTTELPVKLLRNKKLETAYVNFSCEPLYEDNGKIDGIMAVGVEVTEQVLIHKKIEENEERLKVIISASEMGTWELDLTNKLINYSDRFLEILGRKSKTDLSLDLTRKLIHPDDLRQRDTAFANALKTGRLIFSGRIIWEDGSVHWIESKGKVFYDEQNNAVKIIGTIRDITDEKDYQQQLEEREQKFRLLADSMPQHIWTADPSGSLNYFNQSVFDYSGMSPEQVNEQGWITIVHPDDREENIKEWINSITTGKDFLFEHRFRRHDGVYRWQLSRALPQKDQQGNIRMWVGTSTDIEDQKIFSSELEKQVVQRTKELEKKNIDLKKMNKELESFAYISSHDLQEPLRKIQTFSGILLDNDWQELHEKTKDYFQRIRKAAGRMQTLINDLLAYSRTSTADRIFKKTKFNTIVEQVKEDLKEEIELKQAVIEINGDCEMDIITFQFRQLLQNLFTNALKFSVSGKTPRILISTDAGDTPDFSTINLPAGKKYCHIAVSDNGIGFDSAYNDKIFELFQRLHGKNEYSGTGIGLAIVKKIVENHDGFITASSEINKGSTFNIYIPLR